MDTVSIIKYGVENTILDYEKLRNIAYKENIDDNILVGTVESPKYNLYLIYKDWDCVWFGWYNVSKKDPLSHKFFEKHGFYQYWFAKSRIYDKNNNKYLWTVLLEKII